MEEIQKWPSGLSAKKTTIGLSRRSPVECWKEPTSIHSTRTVMFWLACFCTAMVVAFKLAGNLSRSQKSLPLPPGPKSSWFGKVNLPTSHPWHTYAKWKDVYGMFTVLNTTRIVYIFLLRGCDIHLRLWKPDNCLKFVSGRLWSIWETQCELFFEAYQVLSFHCSFLSLTDHQIERTMIVDLCVPIFTFLGNNDYLWPLAGSDGIGFSHRWHTEIHGR